MQRSRDAELQNIQCLRRVEGESFPEVGFVLRALGSRGRVLRKGGLQRYIRKIPLSTTCRIDWRVHELEHGAQEVARAGTQVGEHRLDLGRRVGRREGSG